MAVSTCRSARRLGAAVRLWPANAGGWRGLAAQQMDRGQPKQALRSARQAVRRNRFDGRNWHRLAMAQIAFGQIAQARASLGQVTLLDHGFQSRWQYANLLLLTGEASAYWPQAAQALRAASRVQAAAVLAQSLSVAGGDAGRISAWARTALSSLPPSQRFRASLHVLRFFVDHGALSQTGSWWRLSLRSLQGADGAVPDERRRMAEDAGDDYLRRLLSAAQPGRLLRAWQEGVAAGCFDQRRGPSPHNLVSDPAFAAAFQPGPGAALDWHLCTACGPLPGYDPVASGLRLRFSGNQAEQERLAWQPSPLSPGVRYRVSVEGRAGVSATGRAGVIVSVVPSSGAVLMQLPVPMKPIWQGVAGCFVTPRPALPDQLQVGYQRPQGETLLQGTVHLRNLSLVPWRMNGPC